MHVGINARVFSVPEPGGDARAGRALARALADREDLRVTLFGHDRLRERFPDQTVVSRWLPTDFQTYGLAWEQTALPRLAGAAGVDALLCPNSNGPVVSTPVPVVTWLHDVAGYLGHGGRLFARLQRLRVPRVVAHSDVVMTVSGASRDRIAAVLGLDLASIPVVHNGIDPLYLSDDPGDPLPVPDRYVLFVGAMNGRKNVRSLVAALRRLRQRRREADRTPDRRVRLVIVGPSPSAVYQRVRADLDRPWIDHLGYVTDRELAFLYDRAELFAFPSLREGFGLPPLEAMARGTPVVASDRAPMPELLGSAARLVDATDPAAIADGIEAVLSNPETRERLVRSGRERAAQFTWERTAEQVVEILNDVAAAKNE